MAHKHQLSLELPASNNPAVLRVVDTSSYSTSLVADCPRLQIIPPGFVQPLTLEVTPGFSLSLDACALGLQQSDCGQQADALPDGVYRLRYSVLPNDRVFVEYQHLRVTQTLNLYMSQLAQLELGPCEPGEDLRADLRELQLIRSFIEAAQAQTEFAHNPTLGVDLLAFAGSRLSRRSSRTC